MTIQLTLMQQAGEPVGDGGDQYVGLDRFGRLVDQRWLDGSGADVERVQYGYDRASNRVWRANPVATAAGAAQDEFYVHDGLQQLSVRQQGVLNADRTGISHLPAQEEDFTYDPLGNWSEYVVQAGGGTTLDQTRTHNVDNEITTLAGDDSLLGYDQAGNMTTCPQPADGTSADALTWDAWNRLVAVESVAQVAGNSFTSACLYDGLTRRVSKTITVRTGHTATVTARNYFYSDQWKVLQDQTTARRPQQPDQRQFVWRGCAEDKLILRDQGGAAVSPRLFALDDGKNVSAVCDESGAVAERYGYSGFGTPVFMDAGFTAQDGSNCDWETLFCGYRFDADTGLYQVRYRFLHPQLGRWLSRDPIGEDGGWNIYGYVQNIPIVAIDALGLKTYLSKAQCEQALNTIENQGCNKIIIDKIAGHGCPKPVINCECKDGRFGLTFGPVKAGGKDGGSIIELGAGQHETVGGLGYTLHHELIHAYDNCFGTPPDLTGCALAAWKEVRGRGLSGNCGTPAPTTDFRDCVISGAEHSLSRNPDCKDYKISDDLYKRAISSADPCS